MIIKKENNKIVLFPYKLHLLPKKKNKNLKQQKKDKKIRKK